ncbi:hypothetical protein [Dongia sp. agr-C8]
MSRLYYPPEARGKLATGGGGQGFDAGEAGKKIAKLIPAELITGYTGLIGVALNIRVEWQPYAYAAFFLLCWVLTPFYLNQMAEPGKPKRNHLIVSTLAFPVWAYLVSGHQVIPDYFDAGLATAVAIVFSLITGLIPMNK